eukprot:5103346-Pleurochrysis_carterae.AAC.6
MASGVGAGQAGRLTARPCAEITPLVRATSSASALLYAASAAHSCRAAPFEILVRRYGSTRVYSHVQAWL